MPKVQLPEASTATPIAAGQPDSDFYQAFASRVRETVAPEHARIADHVEPAQLLAPQPEWTVRAGRGVSVSGYLPPWATNDPSRADIPLGKLEMVLDDLTLSRYYDGPTVKVNAPLGLDAARLNEDFQLFRISMYCAPYSDDPVESIPHAIVAVLEDCVIENAGPDELTDLAAKLRAQAEVIEQAARDLVAAREDWAANGGQR